MEVGAGGVKLLLRHKLRPWRGYHILHNDFPLLPLDAADGMALFFPIDETAPPYAFQVMPGTWYGYHASRRVDIVPRTLRDLIIVYGTALHKRAGS